jgi:ankyrin repeat protein
MSLARKGSRIIILRGDAYRWKGSSTVTVERLDGDGSRLRVHFDLDRAEPKQVADSIAYALDRGWDPARRGKPFVVENGNETLPEHPLWQAVKQGDEVEVSALLEAGVNPNTHFQGVSALRLAAWGNQPEVVRVLLAAGADPNGGGDEWPPLTTSAALGWREVVDLLLAHGADVHVRDKHGRTALWRAANNCYLDWLEMGVTTLRQTKSDFEAIYQLLQNAGATETLPQ